MRHLRRGFTLIEILVVVLIIGLVSAGIMLSVTASGRDRDLEHESERMTALLQYTREQSELQTREFGLLCTKNGYEFVTFDARSDQWRSVEEDEVLRQRELPGGLTLRLVVEGRPVILMQSDEYARKREQQDEAREKKEKEKDKDDGKAKKPLNVDEREEIDVLEPQLMIFSNGDLTPFQLTIERVDEKRSITIATDDQGVIAAQEMEQPKI